MAEQRLPRDPFDKNKREAVRLACPCGRNLADVRLTGKEPWGDLDDPASRPRPGELEPVFPFPRPGVRQVEHSHRAGHVTFRWDCRCGQTWEARRDKLEAIWSEHVGDGPIVRLTLGRDVL